MALQESKAPRQDPSKDKYSKTLREWLLASTSHGLPNIFRNESIFLKILWTICFLASTGFCCYSVYTTLLNYLDYNVVTKISTVYKNPIDFPAITFCNVSPFITNKSISFVKDVLQRNGVDELNTSFIKSFLNYPTSQITANIYFLRHFVRQNAMSQNDSLKQEFGLPMKDFLIGCTFSSLPCNETELRWIYQTDYGNCYQFNVGINYAGSPIPVKKITQTNNGLNLVLFVGQAVSPFALSFEVGVHLFIHHPNQMPFSKEGINVAPGAQTNIILSKTKTQQLPDPYNDCYDDLSLPEHHESIIYKETLMLNYTYSQKLCLALSEQKFYIEKCNCADAMYAKFLNVKACTSFVDYICVYKILKYISENSLDKDFVSNCPQTCSNEYYNYQTSLADFPSESYANWLLSDPDIIARFEKMNQPANFESLRKSIVWVNLDLDDTKYTLIEQTASQELLDLLGSIGGTMGLWIGISFLSFIELVEIVFQLLFITCERTSKKAVLPTRTKHPNSFY